MAKTIERLEDLTPDPENCNQGTLRGSQILDRSLETHGAGRSIVVDRDGVVIAGNKTLEAAVARGLTVKVVQTAGERLVAVQRQDLDLDDQKTRELAYLDNRAAEVGLQWDVKQIEADLASGIDLGGLFSDAERGKLLNPLLVSTEPEAKLLRAVLDFDNAEQRAAWMAVMILIAAEPGARFAEKLIAWVDRQIARLPGLAPDDRLFVPAAGADVIVDEPVTSAAVAEAATDLERRFDRTITIANVTCPACGQEFGVQAKHDDSIMCPKCGLDFKGGGDDSHDSAISGEVPGVRTDDPGGLPDGVDKG